MQGSILLIDDDEDILTAGKLLLKRSFDQITLCKDPRQIPQLMAAQQFDAILLDMNFGPGESTGEQGYYWLKHIMATDPQAVVIMITAHGGVDVAVEAMKMGATDFIAKPWQNEKLVATLSAAVKLSVSRREANQLRDANKLLVQQSGVPSRQLLGNSTAMQHVHSLIERTAATDANVLVLGENGTGKELVARALHNHSHRAGQIFMSVDLGALSESLFESELFGYKKGAFTGATRDQLGKLQSASGGTLFLDEVGNLPLHLQAKLLTVLEQRQVTPLGSHQSVAIDVRIIAATNLDKARLADEQHFRQDLLFRLNTVEIVLPPLRQRPEDIPLIAEHYLHHYCRKYHKDELSISTRAMSVLQQYHWPGNVRALRHAIERAVILATGKQLDVEDFLLQNQAPAPPSLSPQSQAPAPTAEQQDLNLERMEKQTIKLALTKHGYNISHAAKELGLTRAALYRRMEKHGI